jgi:anhydro-N-acetylmuramic acid kinase
MSMRWIIGLSSGSSADRVDAALVEAQGVGLDLKVRCVHVVHPAMPRDLRRLLLQPAAHKDEVKQVSLVHRLLGETLAAAARQVADQASFSLQHVQCLGCSGFPLWHDTDGRFPSALDLGMATVVAERTGVTTISDFAARDVAAAGQGAPLLALADHLLLGQAGEDRLLLQLGGTARVVYLPACARVPQVVGFDAGPCNSLLDGLMVQVTVGRESFDAGGKHGVQGRCREDVVQRWLGHPYLQRRPPKRMPRGAFGQEFIMQAVETARKESWSVHDLLCTATHFVARSVTQSLRRFLPEVKPARAILTGGGVRNGLLWHLLGQQLGCVTLEKSDVHGVPAEAHQAVAAAVLAALTVDGVPGNVPSATGASGARLLGSLTPGSSANWARCAAWVAAQLAPLTVPTPE